MNDNFKENRKVNSLQKIKVKMLRSVLQSLPVDYFMK